ncbi:Uncharacterised protein [Mycobacteroides abscessus subsp. abscessus]|nr:Uncharacterised protein [Mycobacteroides abscessus subsp. abscessus]
MTHHHRSQRVDGPCLRANPGEFRCRIFPLGGCRIQLILTPLPAKHLKTHRDIAQSISRRLVSPIQSLRPCRDLGEFGAHPVGLQCRQLAHEVGDASAGQVGRLNRAFMALGE